MRPTIQKRRNLFYPLANVHQNANASAALSTYTLSSYSFLFPRQVPCAARASLHEQKSVEVGR
jgi:hypothetical protein